MDIHISRRVDKNGNTTIPKIVSEEFFVFQGKRIAWGEPTSDGNKFKVKIWRTRKEGSNTSKIQRGRRIFLPPRVREICNLRSGIDKFYWSDIISTDNRKEVFLLFNSEKK